MKLITPIMFLALAAAIFYWVINPQYKQIQSLQTDRDNYTAAIERAKLAGIKRDNLVNKYNSFTDTDLTRLEAMLPDTSDNIKLIVDLNAIAAKYGASLKNIKISDAAAGASQTPTVGAPGDIQAPSSYKTMLIGFDTTMTYDNFLKFLTDLQQDLRLNDVASIAFTSSTTGTYNYTITLKTYLMQ